MSRLAAPLLVLVLGAAAVGCGGPNGAEETAPTSAPSRTAPSTTAPGTDSATAPTGPSTPTGSPIEVEDRRPLAGKVVVLDPGHQLGNRNHAAQINASVDAGGFTKACNTTGTATDSGYPEATFTWQVSKVAQRLLRRLGARVLLTRDANSDDLWGPCIDVRGSIGNPGQPGPDADLRISIHGDGVLDDDAVGFHVITPGVRDGWTDDVAKPSLRLARQMRDALVAAGFVTSTYTGADGIDERTDLGTLNHSDIPVVMVELGNMRASTEAAVMQSAAGQARYARAMVAAIRVYLAR